MSRPEQVDISHYIKVFYSHFKTGKTKLGFTFILAKRFRRENFVVDFSIFQ
jgi:hypothetical protein